MWHPCWIALIFVQVVLQVPTALADCVPEFEVCAMNRDCCDTLQCTPGDWEVTTDSTCLSKRSIALDNLTDGWRLRLIVHYYGRLEKKNGKTPQEIRELVERNSRSFSKLVARLERKYKQPVYEDNCTELYFCSSTF